MKRTELILPLLLLTISLLSLSTTSQHDYYNAGKHQERQQGKNYNPYIFGKESFDPLVTSEHGTVKILKAFTELSPLLNKISNYRLGGLVADPLTFVVPTHFDADSIYYVVEGEGAIALLHEGSRDSHSLEKGDIVRVCAGSIMYLINKNKSQKLKIAKLLHPVGNIDKVQAFYSAGKGEADSYYQSFSIEILEAALNTRRDRLQQFFASQKSEVIIKAPEEKIRAIAQRSSKPGSGPWPFMKEKRPFNLLNKRPIYKNNRGLLFEADSNDYEQLKSLNAKVSYTNISCGSMLAPFINTRAFKIAAVVEGSGYVEIVTPAERERQGTSQHYTRVSSQISKGSVFVIPPGHPTAIVASKEQNLQMIGFEVHAENNELVFIAGKNNILNELEDEAKELAFGVSVKMADEMLRGQEEEVFMAGPWEREKEEGGKRDRPLMESIVEVV